jgi:hypothetical protein
VRALEDPLQPLAYARDGIEAEAGESLVLADRPAKRPTLIGDFEKFLVCEVE